MARNNQQLRRTGLQLADLGPASQQRIGFSRAGRLVLHHVLRGRREGHDVTRLPNGSTRSGRQNIIVGDEIHDATIIAIKEGQFDYQDCLGEVMEGPHRLACQGIVRGGNWVTA